MADDTVRAPIMPYVTQTNSKLISYPDDNGKFKMTSQCLTIFQMSKPTLLSCRSHSSSSTN